MTPTNESLLVQYKVAQDAADEAENKFLSESDSGLLNPEEIGKLEKDMTDKASIAKELRDLMGSC